MSLWRTHLGGGRREEGGGRSPVITPYKYPLFVIQPGGFIRKWRAASVLTLSILILTDKIEHISVLTSLSIAGSNR